MGTTRSDEVSEILDRVKDWPTPSRIALAKGILESLERPGVGEVEPGPPTGRDTRGVPAEAVVGLLRTDRDPPGDEQCRQIVEDERWKKYGS